MAPWSAFACGALIVPDLQCGGLFSRRDDLENFLDHLARVLAGHRLTERLLDAINDVALGLKRLALRVQLDVSLLELRDCYAHLLLDRRQSLRGCSRLYCGDLDRTFELSDPDRVAGPLSIQRRLRLGKLVLQLGDRPRVLVVERSRELLERPNRFLSRATL